MNKLRILVVFANNSGCSYYRAICPFGKLQELYPHRVEIRFNDNPLGMDKATGKWIENWTFEDMKWAHVVMVNNISNFGGPYTARVVGKAKEFGKFVHFDTDDLLTELYEEHHLSGVYKDLKLGEITKFIYSNSDLVTVTQRKFAERIKPFCTKFLAVIKNAIDYNLPAWNQQKRITPQVHVGWAGGIHHNPDVKVFASVPAIVNQKVGRENIFWDFYGYPPPNPDPKVQAQKGWEHSVWAHYQRQLLAGLKGPPNYAIHYALSPQEYGIYYSWMDIAIAPLHMNPFNDSKSDIKVAEAGRYKVPLIASNVGCYNETIENGKTGYLIDPDAPKSEWIRLLTKVAQDHKLRRDMGENLFAISEQIFDLNKVAHERLNIYDKCFQELGADPRNEN